MRKNGGENLRMKENPVYGGYGEDSDEDDCVTITDTNPEHEYKDLEVKKNQEQKTRFKYVTKWLPDNM